MLAPEWTILTEALALLATVGELWIIGYLLFTRTRVSADIQPALRGA